MQSQNDNQGIVNLMNEIIPQFPKTAKFYSWRGPRNITCDITAPRPLTPRKRSVSTQTTSKHYIRGNALIGMGQAARGQQDLQRAK